MKNTVLYGDERKSITEYQGRFLVGDCANILGEFPNNTVDLVFTSPPYADQDKAYKNKESKIHPDKYIDWFMPIANELYRVLKDNGSFILNINDKVVNHFQHLYVFEILLKLCKETGFNLVRDYIWHNPCTPPNVFSKGKLGRTKKSHEYVFWFSKGEKWTFEIEPILKPYSKKMKNIINGMSSEQKKELAPDVHLPDII